MRRDRTFDPMASMMLSVDSRYPTEPVARANGNVTEIDMLQVTGTTDDAPAAVTTVTVIPSVYVWRASVIADRARSGSLSVSRDAPIVRRTGSNDGTTAVTPVRPGPTQAVAIHMARRVWSRAEKKLPGTPEGAKTPGTVPPARAAWAYEA